MMKRSLNFVLAAVLAGGTSLASAQIGPHRIGLSSSAGLGSPPPSALNPYGIGMPSAAGLGSTGPSLFSPNPGAISSSRVFGNATSPPLGSYGSSMGSGSAAPSPLIPGEVGAMANTPPSPTTRYPLANCYAGGCFGTDGTRYVRGAGDVLFGSNGKICQYAAPGAPLVCN
jgi:hypothetical protein